MDGSDYVRQLAARPAGAAPEAVDHWHGHSLAPLPSWLECRCCCSRVQCASNGYQHGANHPWIATGGDGHVDGDEVGSWERLEARHTWERRFSQLLAHFVAALEHASSYEELQLLKCGSPQVLPAWALLCRCGQHCQSQMGGACPRAARARGQASLDI